MSSGDFRTEQIKKLLIKFRKNVTLNSDESPDFDDFFKLLDLNSQLTNPKGLCLQTWSLVSEAQARDHRTIFGYTILHADQYSSKESFLQIAKDNGKCVLDECGRLINLITPTSAPPAQNKQIGSGMSNAGGQDSQMSVTSTISAALGRGQQGVPMQNQGQQGAPLQEDFGDEISILNSYAGNNIGGAGQGFGGNGNAGFDQGRSRPGMYDEDGAGGGVINTGIEIIRLNKKFDIFMKRFMRAEEDIKEVKQNFYRVMHCAFAKYEQGFKRKNEYLERRRVKRREEIDRGVAQELKKRGMAGELEDPLLMQSVGPRHGPVKSYEGAGHNGGKIGFSKDADDSTMGLGGMGEDEESQTIRNIDQSKKKSMGMTGIDDSELTNNIVGLGLVGGTQKKAKLDGGKKKEKKGKDKKKKKDKKKDESD